jgi:hypothetical protein
MSQPAPAFSPPPTGPAQKKKKGMSGCLIAIFVFAGVIAIGVLIFAIGMWRALSTPEGKQLVKAIGDTAKLMEEAQNAPGAKEVAKKGGCQQALVIDVQKMAELVDEFGDAGMKDGTSTLRERMMVTCQVGFARTPPTCETLAQTYVDAAHPTEPFRVTVQKQGDTQRVCDRGFTSTGQPLPAQGEPSTSAPAP